MRGMRGMRMKMRVVLYLYRTLSPPQIRMELFRPYYVSVKVKQTNRLVSFVAAIPLIIRIFSKSLSLFLVTSLFLPYWLKSMMIITYTQRFDMWVL
jgi:hypothetical protein